MELKCNSKKSQIGKESSTIHSPEINLKKKKKKATCTHTHPHTFNANTHTDIQTYMHALTQSPTHPLTHSYETETERERERDSSHPFQLCSHPGTLIRPQVGMFISSYYTRTLGACRCCFGEVTRQSTFQPGFHTVPRLFRVMTHDSCMTATEHRRLAATAQR